MARTMRRSAALLVLAGLIAGCSGGSDGSGGSDESGAAADEAGAPAERRPEEFDGGDFYAAPDRVPDDEHGTLVRYQPVDALDVGGATAWRMMYVSESLEGEPIVVTGTALVPPGEAPAGGRPVPPELVLTPAGEAELPQVDEGCVGEVIEHFADTPNAKLLKPGLAEVEPWADLAPANDPGRVATDSPILIVHSAADDVVPATLSQLLVQRMCGEGQVVERRVYDKGQSHVEAVPDAVSDGFEWLQQQAAGDEPVSTCAAG